VIIMGAGGRDFHNFNVVFRDDPSVEVAAFTATQIPGIAGRRYPAALAGPRYPNGIPILGEEEMAELVERERIDEVVFAYSDVSDTQVMRCAEIALAAGADFALLGPRSTMLTCKRPVLAVCAVRTGAGKSQVTRAAGLALKRAGLTVAAIRHPMPYHDLGSIEVQRFQSIEQIDASKPTIEEREEYEPLVAAGIVVYAGVDYAAILEHAEREADVVIWDGGNNDFSFVRPDLLITVVDPLRAGDELGFHPGEANLRMADVVLINKIDSATPEQLATTADNVAAINPRAEVLSAASPVSLQDGPDLEGKAVLVVEDGPSVTHGGMPFGAGTIAAREAAARELVDPRPVAVGSIAETFRAYPHLGPVLPAMGYSRAQLADLEATINAVRCDVVVTGSPIALGRLIDCVHPIRHATYELELRDGRTLEQVLAPLIALARG
jgi:predicted GTPase